MSISAALLGMAALTGSALGQTAGLPSNYGPAVKWTQVHQGVHCAIVRHEMAVINSEQEWRSYFNRAFPSDPGVTRDIPKPANWQKEIIIAIHAGQQPTPGYTLNVYTIARRQSRTYDIDVFFERPHQRAVLPQVTTSPWVVIKVEKTSGTPRLNVINTQSRTIQTYGPSYRPSWRSCWGSSGEAPHYMDAQGVLIPLNDEARRRMGLPPAEKKEEGSSSGSSGSKGSKDKDKSDSKDKGGSTGAKP